MIRIKDYMQRLETEMANLKVLIEQNGVTPEQVLQEMTPTERKLVDMLGGETMIYGLVNGTIDKYGKPATDGIGTFDESGCCSSRCGDGEDQ